MMIVLRTTESSVKTDGTIHIYRIYGLFNDFSVAYAVQRRITGWLANDELETIWNEAAVALFKVISRNFSGGTEENHWNQCKNS